jgi:hypothetical protein
MDFIEWLFGISPDGGDGTTELMLLATLVGIIVLLGTRIRRWKLRGSGPE